MAHLFIILLDIFGLGGIERYTRHLFDALQADGDMKMRVSALSLHDRDVDQNPWTDICVATSAKTKVIFVNRLLFVADACKTMVTKKPALVICAHVNLAPLALYAKSVFGSEYIVITHGIDVWNVKKGTQYRSLRGARLVIAASNYTRSRLIENGIDPVKIRLLQNPVDTGVFYPKPVNLALKQRLALEHKTVLLTVGRMSARERYKGHDIMLRVMQKLDDSFVWLIVGQGDDLPRLQHRAETLGVAEKVRFLGRIDDQDLTDYYNLCNCFVMPSTAEGFGIVFLEAMACGKPVVASKTDGSIEPLMNGKLGFLVDPENADEIVYAISRAVTAGDTRTDQEFLRREVTRNFGTQAFRKKLREILSEITKG